VIHDLIIEILRYPSPMLNLALLARRDPPLPISSMRAGGQLTEIGIKDLRFNTAESRDCMKRFFHFSIDEEMVAFMEEKLEGWVTGMRLIALAVSRKDDLLKTIKGVNQEAYPFIQEFLVKEVLERTPSVFAKPLMASSLLDRFCASLCDVFAPSDMDQKGAGERYSGKRFIEWLEKIRLFLIPLDESRHWFRHHHLFQDLLRNRLNSECDRADIAKIHSRVSYWFEENGLIEEAIRHALAADDEIKATRLVAKNRQIVLNLDRWYDLEKWLSNFSDKLIKQQPELLVASAWTHYHHFDIQAIPALLDAAETLLNHLSDDHQVLSGEIDFFRGYLYYFQNDGDRSLKHLQNALEKTPEAHYEVRGQIEILHGLARQMRGEGEVALKTLTDLLDQQTMPITIRITRLQVTLVYIHIIAGNLTAALEANKTLHDFSVKNGYPYAEAWSLYLQGLIHFYRNNLENAIDYFNRALEHRYLLHTRVAVECMAGLSYAYQAMGHADMVTASMDDLTDYTAHLADPAYAIIASASRARLSIMKGAMTSDLRSFQEDPPVENMVWWLEIPAVTHCRLRIAEGSPKSLEQSDITLRKLLQLNEDNHNICHIIQITLLLAMVCKKQKRVEEAMQFLKRSVELAAPGGWIRPFAELGPSLADLLKGLLDKTVAADFIGKIFTARKKDEGVTPAEAGASPPPRSRMVRTSKPQPLVEPLTNRELDVLELLAQRLQTKEIAEKLFVSPETVKSHLKNIYQKLNVSNRREAVDEAKRLEIL
jgi:LuxR family maltose regulon positive regulatory protein